MSDTTEPVFDLVEGQALDESAASMAVQGLKNELNRMHALINSTSAWSTLPEGMPCTQEIWTRIIVIQEALLDVARMLVKKG